MRIHDCKLETARILCAHVPFGAETHPAMYGSPRTDENSNYPHFGSGRALHTKQMRLTRTGCRNNVHASITYKTLSLVIGTSRYQRSDLEIAGVRAEFSADGESPDRIPHKEESNSRKSVKFKKN